MENQEQKNEEIKKYSVEDIIKIFNENKGSENNMPEDILKLINTFSTPMKKDEKNNMFTSKHMEYMEGITLDDIRLINEYAVNEVEKYTKEPFDMSKTNHQDYFAYFKEKAVKEKEKEIKIKNFDKSLHEKYGDKYESVESAARDAFESMAFKDARDILSSRMHGNVERLLEFYDNIFKEITACENIENKKETEIVFPPNSIQGGNYKNNEKKSTYEDFI